MNFEFDLETSRKVVSVALNDENTKVILTLEDDDTVVFDVSPSEALETRHSYEDMIELGLTFHGDKNGFWLE